MSKWQCIKRASFNGDIVITDPCYLRHGGGEENKMLSPENLEEWMTENGGLINTTYDGDWGCTVFKTGNMVAGGKLLNRNAIGEFCADTGKVCVVDIKNVLKLSPKFEDWLKEHSHCGTIIRGFKGTVGLFISKRKLGTYTEVDLRVRGDGDINGELVSFESKQTSM